MSATDEQSSAHAAAAAATATAASTGAVPIGAEAQTSTFRISVVAMTGAAIALDDASAADTVLSVKQRVFAANPKMPVRRQRLMYQPGPFGMDPLADDQTLGGAGVAQDGAAELDVLVADLAPDEVAALGKEFLQVARAGDSNKMIELLDDGVDIEFEGEDNYTAIIYAAANGRTDCLRLLLERGAEKDAKNHNGDTALICAAFHGKTDCVRMLVKAGADMNAQSVEDGRTALIYASARGNSECASLLVQAGADLEIRDLRGMTALACARAHNHSGIVDLLAASGAADIQAGGRAKD